MFFLLGVGGRGRGGRVSQQAGKYPPCEGVGGTLDQSNKRLWAVRAIPQQPTVSYRTCGHEDTLYYVGKLTSFMRRQNHSAGVERSKLPLSLVFVGSSFTPKSRRYTINTYTYSVLLVVLA